MQEMKNTKPLTSHRPIAMAVALGLSVSLLATWALATAFNLGSSNNVPSTFAYEGTLVIDGTKVTGTYDMKFTVVDASAAEHDFEVTGVTVSEGKFAVEIGPLNQSQFDGGDGDDILLKIAVKNNGSYVSLGSGQKLTSVPFAAKSSKAVGADDFSVSGKLGVGTTSPQSGIHISGTTDVSLSTHGLAVFGELSGDNVGIDGNELQARNNGSADKLYINASGGYVGFGGASAEVPLHIHGSADASLSDGSGILMIGGQDSNNLLMDGNELMARSNGAAYRLMINKDGGNVGIGMDPGESYKLDVSGTVRGTSAFVNSSDKRYKKDIETIEDGLAIVLALRGVGYQFRGDEFPKKNFDEGRQIGVIAQEVEEHLPEVVYTDEDGYKSVSYSKLTPVLVEAVKAIHQQVKDKDARIAELESQSKTTQHQQRALEKADAVRDARLEALSDVVCEINPRASVCSTRSASY